MRYIVTGAAGFIGSNLVKELLKQKKQVIGIDCFRDYYSPSIKRDNIKPFINNPLFTLLTEDLASDGIWRLDATLSPDEDVLIYHLAAQAGVRKSWGEAFSLYTNDNILATQNLLEWAFQRGNVANFVFASSSSVYGRVTELPMVEDKTVPTPDSPYGVTKLAAENLVRLYTRNHRMPSVSLRFFTVYGEGQRPDMAFNIFTKAILAGKPVNIFGDGMQTRDFTYIQDVVKGLMLCRECTDGRAMNLGGGNTLPLLEAISTLEEVIDRKADLQFHSIQPGDVRDTLASTELFRRTTGWKPSTPLAEGLAREVRWLIGDNTIG